ncbi:iron-containing redox enzyme family protein [Paraburkholderia sp. MMS20-SJTR3]|uniref:Iron-containing redox enzyme family protein n=1 Tax=Paraburkholderia sejongensis TaxID=2886946 RepID=A0ABS8K3R8_9BURK|nr:iron-containing redox enzyme family protein [Paraburkholderia sp. MMS20-SJTR3]MCC8396803.1 iron-containing redox enzyme family protein [Paraburkholderia sp. MMS20-SJTR3]
MGKSFCREGNLKDIASYPRWLQDVVDETLAVRQEVTGHPLFVAMRDNWIGEREMRAFLVNGWPVVNQFPQYMGMNLRKLGPHETAGTRMARRYLTRNIRVEQNHADYWVDWAAAYDVSREAMQNATGPSLAYALSHWCWKSSSSDSLPAAIAAINFAIEGVTGEWSTLVCSSGELESSYPEEIRKHAMRWLKMHAHYDDAHPWEALDIVATLLGHEPLPQEVRDVKRSITYSYEYFKVSLDCCC